MHHHRESHQRRRMRGRHGGRGPWAWRGRFFGPGEVRLALLSLLEEGPLHGYELMRRLEERSGGVYRASAGTVYPTLQQLEDEGLATSESRDGKRVYRLTRDGERELESEAESVRRIWQRAEATRDWRFATDPDAAELARPAFRVIRAAYRAAAKGEYDGDQIDRVVEILDRAREDLEKLDLDRERGSGR